MLYKFIVAYVVSLATKVKYVCVCVKVLGFGKRQD